MVGFPNSSKGKTPGKPRGSRVAPSMPHSTYQPGQEFPRKGHHGPQHRLSASRLLLAAHCVICTQCGFGICPAAADGERGVGEGGVGGGWAQVRVGQGYQLSLCLVSPFTKSCVRDWAGDAGDAHGPPDHTIGTTKAAMETLRAAHWAASCTVQSRAASPDTHIGGKRKPGNAAGRNGRRGQRRPQRAAGSAYDPSGLHACPGYMHNKVHRLPHREPVP